MKKHKMKVVDRDWARGRVQRGRGEGYTAIGDTLVLCVPPDWDLTGLNRFFNGVGIKGFELSRMIVFYSGTEMPFVPG